jgi:hypothetical protein
MSNLEDAMALGQVPDGIVGLVVDADGGNCASRVRVSFEYSECAVMGVDQVDGGLRRP